MVTKDTKTLLGYQRNILKAFELASASQIAEGKTWYPRAIEALRDIVPANLYSVEYASAICAVLSPRVTWQSNLEGVRRIMRAVSDHSSMVPRVAGVRSNVDKAWSIANDGDVSRVSGPKVSAFYANLTGDFTRVTIDVWAARAAGVPDSQMDHLDRNRYKLLERAYQRIAAELGFLPAELQAIVWIVVRGKGE
jgi:hypothetical protein